MENLRFITFIVESLMAVYRHNGLLKASIVSATNAHRLGAHEAPPNVADVAYFAQHAVVTSCIEKGWPAWVIHSRPSEAQLDAYRDAGARLVLLDPGMDECMARCERDGRPPGTAERIRDWYARPPQLAADWRVTP